MRARKIRLLRNKHHISLGELGKACGISNQRISKIELGDSYLTEKTGEKIQEGFRQIIECRRRMLLRLCEDYENHKDTLLEQVEEDEYEL